jgi:hypothetical protein
MLGPAPSQPPGKLKVSWTGVGPAEMRCVFPEWTRTATTVGYGLAVGSRAGGSEADTAAGTALGAVAVAVAIAARDGGGVALATGTPAVVVSSLVRNAKPTNAIAARATAAGPLRRRRVTALNAASPDRPPSAGSGDSRSTRFVCLLGSMRDADRD